MKKFKLKYYKLDTGINWGEIKLEFTISFLKNFFRSEKTEIYIFNPQKKLNANIQIKREKDKNPRGYIDGDIFYEMINWCEENAEYAKLRMHRFSGSADILTDGDDDIYHEVEFEFYEEDYLKFLLIFG